MRHQNSVLHGLLKQIPWSAFDRLVDEHGADRRVRRLTTRGQLVALLHALRLSGIAEWAHFCEGTTGAKLHLVLDPDAGLPLYLEVTPARVN